MPSVQYLALGTAATVVAIVLAASQSGGSRWVWFTCIGLGLLNVVALPRQLDLLRIENDWDGWQRSAGNRGLAAMRTTLDAAIVDGHLAVERALVAPMTPTPAFAALADNAPPDYERGVVLYAIDTALAWSGTIRVPTDSAPTGIDVVRTPIYTELRVTRSAGLRRATAVVLLSAVPPGDSLSHPLVDAVATRENLHAFDVTPPAADEATPAGQVLRYDVAGQRLLDIRYMPQSQEAVAIRTRERARIVVSAILAFVLLAFIIANWRGTRALAPRLAAIGLALVCTAIVPINQYSNTSRLFDPQVYFVDLGRQLTANAAALTITCGLALLALIAVVRPRRRRTSRTWAIVTVVIVAGLGPFLRSSG